MALIKQVNFKGASANYWVILAYGYAKTSNSTSVVVGLYVNKTKRQEDIKENVLKQKQYTFVGEFNRNQLYNKVKESVPQKVITKKSFEGDEENPPTPEEFTMLETNELFGAEDDV